MSTTDRSDYQADGVTLIAAERARQQTDEGWTPEHDDEHAAGDLVAAAREYAGAAITQVKFPYGEDNTAQTPGWPWHPSWWKPSDEPVRNLVKAGALIAAEIDRLQRTNNASCSPAAAVQDNTSKGSGQ